MDDSGVCVALMIVVVPRMPVPVLGDSVRGALLIGMFEGVAKPEIESTFVTALAWSKMDDDSDPVMPMSVGDSAVESTIGGLLVAGNKLLPPPPP